MRFYDWRTNVTLIDGVPVTGWAPGDDCFKAERLQDMGTLEIGADGGATWSINPDKSGQVTVKLMQTSPTNAYLNKINLSQENLATFIPIQVTQADPYRGDKVGTTLGVIKKMPNHDRGAKQNVVEWVFVFPELYTSLGDPTFAGVPTAIAEALG